jgi:hypothetical protein
MENQKILISATLGALVVAVINAVPFLNFINCFCCIGIVIGGAFALIHYSRNLEMHEMIQPPIAITLGITTGIIAAFISLLFEWIIFTQFGHWYVDLLLKMIENMEEIPPFMEKMVEQLEEERQYDFFWTSILLRNLIIMPIFCLTGSLITRLYLNRNRGEDKLKPL